MEEIVNKLESTGCEVNIRNCGGVYRTMSRKIPCFRMVI